MQALRSRYSPSCSRVGIIVGKYRFSRVAVTSLPQDFSTLFPHDVVSDRGPGGPPLWGRWPGPLTQSSRGNSRAKLSVRKSTKWLLDYRIILVHARLLDGNWFFAFKSCEDV